MEVQELFLQSAKSKGCWFACVWNLRLKTERGQPPFTEIPLSPCLPHSFSFWADNFQERRTNEEAFESFNPEIIFSGLIVRYTLNFLQVAKRPFLQVDLMEARSLSCRRVLDLRTRKALKWVWMIWAAIEKATARVLQKWREEGGVSLFCLEDADKNAL